MSDKNPVWAFFGTPEFSVMVLNELKAKGFLPKLIVTTEDKSKGRKLALTPPPVKIWAEKEGIDFIQLKTLRKPESVEAIKSFFPSGFDLFIVASYGKIIPQEILGLPKHGSLNIHPSLLPKLRGASPLQSAILSENETGVSIMLLDADTDHGPILVQEKINIEWPPYFEDLEKETAKIGSRLLIDSLNKWMDGKIEAKAQDDSQATLCQKIEKREAEIDLSGDPELNLRKIRAFHIWPGAYIFDENKKRIIVKRASLENGELKIERVIPEGKKEMGYKDYLNGKKSIQNN